MYYIFVVNSRADKASILDDVRKQISDVDINYTLYRTKGPGDATRFVRLYCEFHPKEEVCFVACGGSGTFNEVASGVIGYSLKYVAFMAYGLTNDLTKYFEGRDFKSLRDIMDGEAMPIDAIRCNGEYAFNVASFGFEAMVGFEANMYAEAGDSKPYERGIVKSVFKSRYNNFKILADGRPISKGRTLQVSVANARWCGGQFMTAPTAIIDDGYLDLVVFRAMSILSFARVVPKYASGKHITDPFCQKYLTYRRIKHMEISSPDIMFISLDGEITASTHFSVDVVPKAVTMMLPTKKS